MAKIRTAVSLAEMKPFTLKMKMATVFAAFTLLLQLLGVVTSSWVRVTVPEGPTSVFGLWQGCVRLTEDSNHTCLWYTDVQGSDWENDCWGVWENDTARGEEMCTILETLDAQPWPPDWFIVIRVLEIVGLGGVVLSMFISLLCLVYADLRQKCTGVILILISFTTASVIFTGGVLMINCTDRQQGKAEAQPSWSLDVSMLSAVVAIITGSVVIIDIKEEACLNMYQDEDSTL